MIRYVKVGEKRISLSTVVLMAYIAFYVSGFNGAGHNYIQAGLFTLWNLAALWEDGVSYKKAIFCIPNLFLGGFLLFYFFSSAIVGSIIYTVEYAARYLMLCGCFSQFLYYKNRNDHKEIKVIVGFSLLAYLFFSLRAIIFYIQNPTAARVLAADYYAFDTIAIGGGYAIAFGAAILLTGLFEMQLNGRFETASKKVLCLAVVVLLFVLVVKTESAITLIAAIAGLAIALVNRFAYGKEANSRNNLRRIVGTILIVILLLLVFLNLNDIGKTMMDMTGDNLDNLISRRFYRIGEKLYYFGRENKVSNYVDTRLETVKISWNTFLKNPIFGVGHKCGNVFKRLSDYGVGTHSSMFDALAQHGIIGASMFFVFLYTAIKRGLKDVKGSGYIGTVLVMMVLNPFNYFHGYFVLFVLLPMIGRLCDSCRCDKLEETI